MLEFETQAMTATDDDAFPDDILALQSQADDTKSCTELSPQQLTIAETPPGTPSPVYGANLDDSESYVFNKNE